VEQILGATTQLKIFSEFIEKFINICKHKKKNMQRQNIFHGGFNNEASLVLLIYFFYKFGV